MTTPAALTALLPHAQRLWRRWGRDADDLLGVAYLILHEAQARYDPARGVPLRAWLVQELERGLWTCARREWRREARHTPLHEWTAAYALDLDGWTDVEAALASCSPRARQVWTLRLAGQTDAEIAGEMGVAVATVRSLARHGVAQLRGQADA